VTAEPPAEQDGETGPLFPSRAEAARFLVGVAIFVPIMVGTLTVAVLARLGVRLKDLRATSWFFWAIVVVGSGGALLLDSARHRTIDRVSNRRRSRRGGLGDNREVAVREVRRLARHGVADAVRTLRRER